MDSACLETIEAFGTVDVLLNNAGMRQRDLFPPHGAAKVLEISDRQSEPLVASTALASVQGTIPHNRSSNSSFLAGG